ncbi:MAG: type III pantothenate kinase [Bacteroidales bacterium]|nr:type III pantothenate kinase [Bacteroidales bacterium]
MNILIDIGNTSCKVAFCPAHPSERLKGADVMRFATQKETISYVRKRIGRGKAENIILSNVRKRSIYLEKMLSLQCGRFVNFDEDFVHGLLESKKPAASDPLSVLGHMPLGMGADRMAAIFGAEVLYPLQDKLVFDFGTATTVEFIDAVRDETAGTLSPYYRGGSISLGLRTRYRALSHYTAKIPYLNPDDFLDSHDIREIDSIGYDLDTALAAGNILGIMFEIQGYVAAHPQRKLILTGGNSARFAEGLDGKATVEQDLVLIGLEAILELL